MRTPAPPEHEEAPHRDAAGPAKGVGAGRILPLTDPDAADPAVAGTKAANLARATTGLPVPPGRC